MERHYEIILRLRYPFFLRILRPSFAFFLKTSRALAIYIFHARSSRSRPFDACRHRITSKLRAPNISPCGSQNDLHSHVRHPTTCAHARAPVGRTAPAEAISRFFARSPALLLARGLAAAVPAQGPGRMSQVLLGCGRWARAAHRPSREQALDGTSSLNAEAAGRDPDPSTSARPLPLAQMAGSRHSSDFMCFYLSKLDLSQRIDTPYQSRAAWRRLRARYEVDMRE